MHIRLSQLCQVDSEKTVAENIADNAGLHEALQVSALFSCLAFSICLTMEHFVLSASHN